MRILFLTSRFPYPLEKGDKLRAYHQIKELSRYHEIILAAVSDIKVGEKELEELKPYCKKIVVYKIGKKETFRNLAINIFSSRPFQVAYFYSGKFQRNIDQLMEEEKPTHVYCQLIRMAEYVSRRKDVSKILDYMDAFSKGYERMSGRSSVFRKWLVKEEWKRLLRYEEKIFHSFDRHIIISEQDRAHIPHAEREKIFVSSNGVDLEYFSPQEAEKKYDLIFSGNMSYPPNIESVLFLVNEVMPLLLKRRTIRLAIAGATPAPEIMKLKSEIIDVTGWVDDMRPWYAASRICVAPMLISIGLQNKIIQAMAMNIPCVVSTLANNAIGATNHNELMIADSPEEFAERILFLLEDNDKASEMAANARKFVEKNFSWPEIIKRLNANCFG